MPGVCGIPVKNNLTFLQVLVKKNVGLEKLRRSRPKFIVVFYFTFLKRPAIENK